MLEELRPYLAMANGLTEVARQQATEAARTLIAQGMVLAAKGATPDVDVSEVAEEIVESVRANREMLREMIDAEVQRALGGLGFAHADELKAARKHIERVEAQVESLRADVNALRAELAAAGGSAKSKKPAAKKSAKKSASKASGKKSSKSADSGAEI